METADRITGIEAVGNVPWGTHICQFYQTREDLIDILVPYFKAGLESNEVCMWVISEPLVSEEAKAELGKAVIDFDDYIKKGQIEILDYKDWYIQSGKFDAGNILQRWAEKEKEALERGFNGLRVAGNAFWLDRKDRNDFAEYERKIGDVIGSLRMITVCSYPLDRCGAGGVIDVVSNCWYAMIRREGAWKIIESTLQKRTEEVVRRLARFPAENPNPVLRVDKDGTIAYANNASKSLLRHWGCEVGEHLPEKWTERVSEAIKSGASINAEVEYEGQWVFLTLAPVVEMEQVNIYALDITGRKQAEEELRKEKDYIKNILDTVQVIVLELDKEGRIINFNPYMEEISGYAIEEVRGKDWFETFLLESDRKNIEEMFLGAVDDIKTKGNVNPIVTKDGVECYIEWYDSIIKDQDGSTVGLLSVGQDVTERRQGDKKYRQLLEDMNDGYMIIQEGEIVFANRRFDKILGYEPGQLLGKPMDFFLVADKRREGMEQYQRVMRGEKKVPGRHEAEMMKADGTKIIVEVSIQLIQYEGKPAAYVIARDITERKQMEEKHRVLVDDMNDGYVVVQEGIIVFANRRFTRIVGCEPEQVLGRSLAEFTVPENRKSVAEFYRRVMHSEDAVPERREGLLLKGDGTTIIAESSSNILQYEGKPALSVIVRDITERMHMEQALKESEERYRAIFETAAEGIIIADIGRRCIIYSNPAACTMFDYTAEEFQGLRFGDIHPEESLKNIWDELGAVIKDRKTLSAELPCLRKDGTEFYSYANITLVNIGGRSCIAGFHTDITERRKMEEERQKMDRLESVGILAGGIAHDFNNLLTAILGNLSRVRTYTGVEGDVAEKLKEAEKATVRARDLTRQLLTFSKGGAPVKKVISLSEIIEESATFILRGSNVKPVFSIPEDLWTVEADEGQISQVINNLVKNAGEAMPEGGIVEVSARNITVERTGALPLSEGKYIEIEVKDHGTGIRKEDIGRVFDPYFTTKQRGSGLGLASCYSIIRNHGGSITIDSELGTGTTFHIYLPVSGKQAPKTEKEELQPVFIGHGKILVMDDEMVVRRVLSETLKTCGYEVELTCDGAEAIQQYIKARESGETFDAVIMDLTVPGGMGGKETISKLLEIDPRVKAVVSSGYANDPIMAEYRKYGFSAVVVKPYNINEIVNTINSLLKDES